MSKLTGSIIWTKQYRPEQVLVGYEVSPHRAAVGSPNVLREMIKEHGVTPGNNGVIARIRLHLNF